MTRRTALSVMAAVAGGASATMLGEPLTGQAPTPQGGPTFVPDIPGPDPSPRVPTFTPPARTCDTHCHVYGPAARYPYAPTRPYTPPDAPIAALRALHARLGVERGVIVNATPYGRDNRVVIDAIAESAGRYRGVGNVDDRMTDAELAALAAGGLTGCRFTFLSRLGGRPDMTAFDRMVARVVPLGWHVDLYLDPASLAELAPRLKSLPLPYVIDHMGLVDASAGLDQPAFITLCGLLARDEHCWVKITGPERISRTGPPFHDAVPFARQLVETAPDRVLWGTDWPHPNVPVMPNDGDLVDLIPRFAPDETLRRKLLVDNPARLFGFHA